MTEAQLFNVSFKFLFLFHSLVIFLGGLILLPAGYSAARFAKRLGTESEIEASGDFLPTQAPSQRDALKNNLEPSLEFNGSVNAIHLSS